ncbi:MAG: hypothetical protein ACXV8H_07275, partial [Chthoniobacterales bacterium]
MIRLAAASTKRCSSGEKGRTYDWREPATHAIATAPFMNPATSSATLASLRAVFFDLGGTLDGGVHWLDRFLTLYFDFGIELPRETIREAFDAAERQSATDEEIVEADLAAMVALHVKWQLAHLNLAEPGLQERLVEKFVAPMRLAAAANRRLLAELK